MEQRFNIQKIQKYEQQKYDGIRKIINNTKFLAFFAILIFASAIDGLENQTEELITAGSITFGTINIISLVKSICKVYMVNEEIKKLNDRQKWYYNI